MERLWIKDFMIISIIITEAGLSWSLICNVAKHCPTSHSSAYYDTDLLNGYSCNGVDGLASQNFFDGSCVHSLEPSVDPNPWWEVDLGAEYTVESVKVLVRTDNAGYEHYKKFNQIQIRVDGTTCGHYSGPPSSAEMNYPITITCNAGAYGRKVRFAKQISENLQFCEVQVLVSLPSCPDPPVSWNCRDLCYDKATNTNVCPVTTTTEVATVTMETASTSDTCMCPCTSLGSDVINPSTMEEILERLQEVIKDIKIDEKETSSAKRKLISAPDNRPSAVAIGSAGVVILVLVACSILLMDLGAYIKGVKMIVLFFKKHVCKKR